MSDSRPVWSEMPLSAAMQKTNAGNTEQQSQVMQNDDHTSVAAEASAEPPISFIQMAIDVDGTVSILLSAHSQTILNSHYDKDCQSTTESSTGYSSDTVFQLSNGDFCFQMRGGGSCWGKSKKSNETDDVEHEPKEIEKQQKPHESSQECDEGDEQNKQPTSFDKSIYKALFPCSIPNPIINDPVSPSSQEFDPFGIPSQQNEIASVFYEFVMVNYDDVWRDAVENKDAWKEKCRTSYTELKTIDANELRDIILKYEFAGTNILKAINPLDRDNVKKLMCHIVDKKSCAIWAGALQRNGKPNPSIAIPVTNNTFEDTVKKHLTRGIALAIGLYGNAGGDHWFTITGYRDKITITQSWQNHYDIKNETFAASRFFELMTDILSVRHIEAVNELFGPPDGSGFKRYARLADNMRKFEVGKPLVAGRGTDNGQTPTGLYKVDGSNFI